jgi:hypothetical protein
MGTAWQSDAFQSDAFQQYGQVAAAPSFLAAWAANANFFLEALMKKNVASQVIGAQLVSATDGSAFTGAVTVYVAGDGGAQGAGSVGAGACTHEGNGYHSYLPAQAETNFDHIAFTFIGSGAVPSTIQVATFFPQTGDNFARIGAPAGASVSADMAAIKAETATILADTNELQTDWANGGRLDNILDARASQASVDTIDGIVDSILVDTAEIGAAGAGLSAIPWNAAWDAEVQSEATDALNAYDPPTRAELTTDTNSVLTAVDAIPTNAELATALGTADDAVLAQVALVKAKTDLIPSDPADASDVAAAVAAVKLYADRTVVRGTAAGASTTSITTSAFAPSGAAVDQFKGRVVVFDNDTSTAELRGQASLIESNTADATPTLTVTALTTAPAAGDTFSVL